MHWGFRQGKGFGFGGACPPWPYIGRGRGGLPRCGHFWHHGVMYGAPYYGPAAAGADYASYEAGKGEDEIGWLKEQARAIRAELKEIEGRIRGMEGQQR